MAEAPEPTQSAAGTRPRTGWPYLDAVFDRPGSILAMAHRGGALDASASEPENTLGAFRYAVGLGYDYLETDIHATRDGVLVAFHDERLERVTDSAGRIEDLLAADLATVRVGGDRAVPLFGDLLEEFPETRFNIDLKSAAAVPALAGLIDRTRERHRFLVGSFGQRRIDEFRRLTAGSVATAAAPAEVAALLAPGPARMLRAVVRRGVAALQIPRRWRGLPVVSRQLLDRMHRLGVHVHVWTVNDRSDMVGLLDQGVDGLITDRAAVLKDVLLDRQQWRGPR